MQLEKTLTSVRRHKVRYVKYNGGTQGYYSYSDPSCLRVGQIYKVVEEQLNAYDCKYMLEGVDGKFNSVWFDDMPSYFSYGREVPRVGSTLDVVRQEVKDGKLYHAHYYTTHVRKVERLSSNTFLAVTANTVYIVQVMV